jgi:hypothetical protein
VRQSGSARIVVRNPDIRWDDSVISQVYATASEIKATGDPRFFHGIECFIGEAKISVSNIAVRPGEVHLRLDVEWDEELMVLVRYHIVNMELKAGRRPERLRPVEEKAVPIKQTPTKSKPAGKAKSKKK